MKFAKGERVEVVAAYAMTYKVGWRGTVEEDLDTETRTSVFVQVAVQFDKGRKAKRHYVEFWRLRKLSLLELIAEAAQ